MTRRLILPALIALACIAVPSAAQAWPAPQPGQPACIPNGDGTFHIDPVGKPPFPRGSHQPENGKCEGPVVNPPAPPVVPPTPAPCCDKCATPDQITNLQNQISLLQQQISQQNTEIINLNTRVTYNTTDIDALRCQSSRRYAFTARPDVEGHKVTGVHSVTVAGDKARGSSRKLANGRFRIMANYSGLTVPKGQLRTVVVFLDVEGFPKPVRTVQFVRLCLGRDGNPNDRPAQQRAGD